MTERLAQPPDTDIATSEQPRSPRSAEDALPDAPESKLDGGEGNEGGQGFGKDLEVHGKTPVSSEPGEGALDHPAPRQDDEALRVAAPLDDLHAQLRHLGHRSSNLPGAVAAIGPDRFEPLKHLRILSSAAEGTTTRIGNASLSTRV